MSGNAIVPLERIERTILVIRGHRVILDSDLAAIYGTSTKAFNQAIKRNLARFPDDFMFRLTPAEKSEVVTNCDRLSRLKFSPTRPLAFTEHGAIMAASVLNSPRAVEMSVLVVRAFVKLREILAAHRQLAVKLAELERKLSTHDQKIMVLFDAIRELMAPPEKKRRRIGFKAGEEK
jgi:hypothetical protein